MQDSTRMTSRTVQVTNEMTGEDQPPPYHSGSRADPLQSQQQRAEPLPLDDKEEPLQDQTQATADQRRLNEYSFFRQIGDSSEGVVHLMHHEPSGELRVFKRSHGKWHLAPAKTDLCEEARKLQELRDVDRHENIVSVFWGMTLPEENQSIACLDYCEGGDLYGKMQQFRSMEVSAPRLFVLQVTIAIGEALAFLHEGLTPSDKPGEYEGHDIGPQGWAHRDIKPDNIFLRLPLDRYGMPTPVLGDFGQCTNEPAFGGGTWKYQSPEQQQEQLVSTKTDVWSYGATIFELCQVPTKQFWSIGDDLDNLVLPAEYQDFAMQQFLQRCLVVDPEHRIAMSKGQGLDWITTYRGMREDLALRESINHDDWSAQENPGWGGQLVQVDVQEVVWSDDEDAESRGVSS